MLLVSLTSFGFGFGFGYEKDEEPDKPWFEWVWMT